MINDIKNLKENGGASVQELREFFKSLKAKNPQEVIGIVSTSLLVQSLVLSCFATAVFMVAFTVGPYMLYGPNKPAAAGAKPAAVASTSSAAPASTAIAPDATASPGAAGTASVPDVEKAAKVMGLDETKPADPKKNPRDNPDLDKLLDGL